MRLSSLDSLRGIAAASVVLHHCTEFSSWMHENYDSLYKNGLADPMGWLYLTPLRLFVAGPSAVLVFFVISGLVLSLSFIEHDKTNYLAFMTKRMCRVWLPFAVTIIIAAALSLVLPAIIPTNSADWFKYLLERANLHSLFVHLAMTGTNTIFDPPMWSLIHELRISVIFPLVVAATLWNWRAAFIIFLGLCFASTGIIEFFHVNGFIKSCLQTGQYIFLFSAGIAIARRLPALGHHIAEAPMYEKILLWVFALVGVCYGPKVDNDITHLGEILRVVVCGGAAAVLVMLCAVDENAKRFLSAPFLCFLGRISYSLYLVHWVVMAAVLRLVGDAWPLSVSLALGVGCSVIAAMLMERYIERPTIRLGQKFARRFSN